MITHIHDLPHPAGGTYKERNLAQPHAFAVGELVEINGGCRLYVAEQTRDCDGSPLYTLTHEEQGEDPLQPRYFVRGFSQTRLREVHP